MKQTTTKTTTDKDGNVMEYVSEKQTDENPVDKRLWAVILLLISMNFIGFLTVLHVTSHTRYFMHREEVYKR